MPNPVTKTGIALVHGKHQRDGAEHEEWYDPACGCAFHPEPAPHKHPCAAHSATPAPSKLLRHELEAVLKHCEITLSMGEPSQRDEDSMAYILSYWTALHIAALTAERDALLVERGEWKLLTETAENQVKRARQQVERLCRYVKHDQICALLERGRTCTCGMDASLAALTETPQEANDA